MEAEDYRKARRGLVFVLALFVLSLTPVFDPQSKSILSFPYISDDPSHIRWALFVVLIYHVYHLFMASSFIYAVGRADISMVRLQIDGTLLILASSIAMIYFILFFDGGIGYVALSGPWASFVYGVSFISISVLLVMPLFFYRYMLSKEEGRRISEFLIEHEWEMVGSGGEVHAVRFLEGGQVKGIDSLQILRWAVRDHHLELYHREDKMGDYKCREGDGVFTLEVDDSSNCDAHMITHIRLGKTAGRPATADLSSPARQTRSARGRS